MHTTVTAAVLGALLAGISIGALSAQTSDRVLFYFAARQTATFTKDWNEWADSYDPRIYSLPERRRWRKIEQDFGQLEKTMRQLGY